VDQELTGETQSAKTYIQKMAFVWMEAEVVPLDKHRWPVGCKINQGHGEDQG